MPNMSRMNEKLRFERASLNGWYGDALTPVHWDTENMTKITLWQMSHLHDINTGQCVKNRALVFCNG